MVKSSICPTNEVTLPAVSYVDISDLKITIGFKAQSNQQQNCDGTATQTALEIKKMEGTLTGKSSKIDNLLFVLFFAYKKANAGTLFGVHS